MITIDDVRRELRRIDELMLNPNDLEDAYIFLMMDALDHNVGNDMIEILKLVIENFSHENFSAPVTRKLYTYFFYQIFPGFYDNESKIIGHFILEKMQLRASYFEDQAVVIRKILSSVYENEKNWEEAILMLEKNLLDTEQRSYTDDLRLETYIKIAKLYLKSDNPLQAETYIKRAPLLETNNDNLQFLYKVVFARVMECRHKFIDAAQRYIELSKRPNLKVNKRMIILNNTLVCTIVSPMGEPRSKLLSKLYKDERCKKLIKFSILEKLYLCRIIKPNEINELETMVLERQKAIMKEDASILIEAMIDHNILSISKLYSTIKIESLGSMLNIEPRKAESKTGKMISEGLIEGSINQITGFIYFKSQSRANSMQTWDKKIEALCTQIDHIIQIMSADSSTREWIANYTANQMY